MNPFDLNNPIEIFIGIYGAFIWWTFFIWSIWYNVRLEKNTSDK